MRKLGLFSGVVFAGGLFIQSLVYAQPIGGAWTALGPAPSHSGQVEGITNREVVGAINAIAAHPTDANILYLGAVNGGIWSSVNATSASPTWSRLTDALGSLSIGALEIDPTDRRTQTLVAGIARTSSLSSLGGAQIGMLRSTDAGATWTALSGGATLLNRQVVGVAARADILLAATDQGIFRSSNLGVAFTQISGAAGSGIPAGSTSDLSGDPTSLTQLYAAVVGGAARGVYRSTDTGATWTRVSDAALDTAMAASTRAKLAVGASGQVFVAVVVNNRLSNVFRSSSGAGTWDALGVPTTAEQNGVAFGIHVGGQGNLHLSIAADPTNANIVYVGGDRQPYFGEGVSGSNMFFPNSLGANDYSGRLFRADAAQPVATRWAPLTHSGTSNNSSPHADSRDMAFDAQGNLLESSDGGIYKRLAPRLATGSWASLNGDLQTTEYHGIAYDQVSNRVIGGSQDNGTTEQRDPAGRIFVAVSTGDGGDPTVEDRSSSTLSTRYSSFQFLGSLRRRTVNASNVVTSTAFPARTVISGPALSAQFYTPIAANEASATRLLIGAANGVYESFDRGDTIRQISTRTVNQFRGSPLHYGIPGNPELIYLGSGADLLLRSAASTPLAVISSLPGTVIDVAIDPDAPQQLFAMTSTTVNFSSNSGAAFANITGSLLGFSPGALRTLAFIPTIDDALVVGSDKGAFVSFRSTGFNAWARLGSGLPNALLFEFDYSQADNVLIAGTLGRGAWSLTPVLKTDLIFRSGLEVVVP